MDLLAAAATALAATPLGAWVAANPAWYPHANVAHVLGVVLLVGGIGVVDLRLAGFWRALPPAALSAALTPVALAGLALMALSGLFLFASDAAALARSQIFALKLALVAAALTNAALFRLTFAPHLATWHAAPPPAGRALAIVSLTLWLAVLVAGRMIAYA